MTLPDLTPWLTTKRPLRFREDGGFRILMVSDIHGGVGYNKKKTVAAMNALMEAEKPDLVVLGATVRRIFSSAA